MAKPAAEPLAKLRVDGGMLAFEPQIAYAGVRLTVTGPKGFEVIRELTPGEILGVELSGGDGFYKYELRFSPVLDDEQRAALLAARKAGTESARLEKRSAKKTVQSGAFTIAGGNLIAGAEEVEPKGVLTNGDGVIRNSLCVGLDCPDAPVFSDSTILLMENNTRIKFGDTSAAPFPNNDWEIEANSNLSGGANYLGFNDCGTADDDGGCAADLVFAVESGARASALYVESDGDVGFGTSNPVVDLHVVTGNTPTLRLDQDGSSGFTPRVWDIAGNETNFFIRDVTGGSTLPFRIIPGAPSSSILIAADGNVGMGTASPGADLHIRDTAAGDNADLDLEANGQTWRLRTNATNSRFTIINSTTSINPFSLGAAATTNLLTVGVDAANQVTVNGNLTVTGICTGCDAVFSPTHSVEPIKDHAAFMWENSYLPGVGPTPEGETSINVFQKMTGMLQELEKAHIYIEQLSDELTAVKAELAELKGK